MFQLNLPKKTVATAHVAIVCFLIVLGLIFSFLPIIKIKTDDKNTASGIINIVHKFGGNIDLDDLEEIKVSAPKLLRSMLLLSDITKVAEDDKSLSSEEKDDLREKMESKEGKDATLVCVAIVYIITDTFKQQSRTESYDLINIIFNVLITVIALCYLLCLTIAMPIFLIILSIKALIPVVQNFKELHLHTADVANKLPEKLSIILIIMLLQCVLPSVNYGGGTLALLIVTILCIFVNFASTRLITYEEQEFIYLNIVQGTAFLSMIGFFIFFFNILKADIFSTFTHGSWGKYVAKVITSSSRSDAPAEYILDAVLILVYISIIMLCVNVLPKCANRFSCALPEKPRMMTVIPEASILLFACTIPRIVASRESQYANPLDQSSGVVGSFLNLSAGQKSALGAALFGTIIILVSEIAFLVLDKIFCETMSEEEKASILSNSYEPFDFEGISEIALPSLRNRKITLTSVANKEVTEDKLATNEDSATDEISDDHEALTEEATTENVYEADSNEESTASPADELSREESYDAEDQKETQLI